MQKTKQDPSLINDKDGRWWYTFDGSLQPDKIVPRVTNVLEIAVAEKMKNYYTNNSANKQKKVLKETANFGSRLHDLVERDLKGEEVVPDHEMADAFFRWTMFRQDHLISATHNEISAYSLEDGYAGTVDIIGNFTACGNPNCCGAKDEEGNLVASTFDGKAVMDLKTGFYSNKAGWQMAAYRRALIQMGVIDDSYGMVGLSIPRKEQYPTKGFPYMHIDFCELAFLSCFQTWKSLYFSCLNNMNWAWLHKTQIRIKEI